MRKVRSFDVTSTYGTRILYAIFLLVTAILLVNMMIALLSNTYQAVEVRHLSQFIFPTPGKVNLVQFLYLEPS